MVVPKKLKEKWSKFHWRPGNLYVIYWNYALLKCWWGKKIFGAFSIKNIFVVGCNKNKSASFMERDKVSLFQQMKNFNVYLGSVIWTYRTSGQWIIRIANAGIERNIVKPTEKNIYCLSSMNINDKARHCCISIIYRAMIYLSVYLFIMLFHMHCI